MEELTPDPGFLLELAAARMPYGKYRDRLLIDLPEPYVVWLRQKGFPAGKLGRQLETLYVIKANGLEHLVRRLNGPGGTG